MRKFCFQAGLFLAGMTATAALLASSAAGIENTSVPPTVSANSNAAGMEVMTRGPIHEAFAQPVNAGAVNQLVVPKKPPQAIDEIPPDEKPADENATWIGGYWAWDDGRQDFEWVSGVWRVPPQNNRWIAGYWTALSGGYSWVPGFWTPTTAENVVYYPQPPASLERGPTSDQPSPDNIWIPGCWRWVNARYAWQPGQWAAAQSDWIWTPASYCWSPRGWVFCNGYWDYSLERRGLLFAPVVFTNAIFRQPGYTYSPSVALDSGLLTFYLFVRPSCSQYYFGDYYAAKYDRLGIYPWFAVGSHPGYAYDPLFSFYSWRNVGRNPNWARNLGNWYTYYRAHPDQRLPHTWVAAQQALASAGNRSDRQFLRIADTLRDLRKNPQSHIRLTAVSPEQSVKFRESARIARQFADERGRIETRELAGMQRQRTAMGKNVGTMPKTPETLRIPRVAGTQTMKPIVTQPSPERRAGTIQREARRPVIQTQPTTKGGGPGGVIEKKTPTKSMEEHRPLGATEKRTPTTVKQAGPQGGTPQKESRVEQRNIPPRTPIAQRGGTQSPPKENNKDGERKTP